SRRTACGLRRRRTARRTSCSLPPSIRTGTCWSSSPRITTATPSTRLASSHRRTESGAARFVARPCHAGSERPALPVVDWSRPGRPRSAGRWYSDYDAGTAKSVPSLGATLTLAGNSRMMTLVVAAAALVAGAAAALTSGDPRGLLVLALGGIGG